MDHEGSKSMCNTLREAAKNSGMKEEEHELAVEVERDEESWSVAAAPLRLAAKAISSAGISAACIFRMCVEEQTV